MGSQLLGQMPGYGGPGIATGGDRQIGTRAGEPVDIRPFASVSGIYDNGLVGVGLNQNGEIVNPGGLYGIEAGLGVYGSRSWRRNRIGLDYQGNYRHYTSQTYFNGSDHMLGLDYLHQVSRRSHVQFRTMAGSLSRNVGGVAGFAVSDPAFLGLPLTDIFDNRSYFLDVSLSFARQIGSRNSISIGGSAFAVRRQSKVLIGLNGQRAFGEFSRMLSRRSSLGVGYQYFRVEYPRVFGGADVHSLMLNYRRELGKKWHLLLAGGAFYLDFTGIRTVAVDPVITELFGITTGREAFNQKTTTSNVNLNLGRTFRRSSFSLGYNRGANPGNGALLLNRQDAVTASYSYNASRYWSLSSEVGYLSASGYGSYRDRFETYTFGFGAARRIRDGLYFNSAVNFRQMSITSSTFQRFGTRISTGITYSPGNLPISFR